jgi:hypothetical protein
MPAARREELDRTLMYGTEPPPPLLSVTDARREASPGARTACGAGIAHRGKPGCALSDGIDARASHGNAGRRGSDHQALIDDMERRPAWRP